MILDEITLENFGLYAGKQTLCLTPLNRDKPIVLIGGLNGVGKTTVLDALQLCLFGPHATPSNRGSLAYPEYLSRCIHRGSNAKDSGIEIKFRRKIEGEVEEFTLNRSWSYANGQSKERLEVTRNSNSEPSLSKNWASQVEEFFPANIANLFLFDGEQIQAYASPERSSILIRAAIHNLLGLDIVDQLEKDLIVYERQKRSEKKGDTTYASIENLQDELGQLQKRIDTKKQERAALRTHKLDRLERKLKEVQRDYQQLGGSLYDRREEIEEKWANAIKRINDSEVRMREFASSAAPLLLARKLLESIETRDRQEEQSQRALHVHHALKERDRNTLARLRDLSVPDDAIGSIKEFFDSDRANRKKLGARKSILNLPLNTRRELHSLMKDGMSHLKREAALLSETHNQLLERTRNIKMELENVPSPDTISALAEKQTQLKAKILRYESRYAALEEEIQRLTMEFERKSQSLAGLLEADTKRRIRNEDRSRILFHSSKVRNTLASFGRAVIARHVSRIEHLVLESYQQLLRKSALVTRLSIDTNDFSLSLVDRDGHTLKAERLSAGERQLLAIALLWGLAKASNRPLPTAIDTPLGRLDSGHRQHIVERYLPFASHQIILLSTDEEITGEYLKRLTPSIGRSYYLAYDDKRGETRIVPGYFETREAA